MNVLNKLGKLAGDAVRAIRTHNYEMTENGIYLPGAKAFVGGVFRHSLNDGPAVLDPNRIVTEGLVYLLNAALGGQSQVSAFYLAPFSGNVTPAAGWTGANFTANSTEFTGYTPSTRMPWTTVPAVTASIGNSAALVASTLTMTAGSSLYGIGLLESQAKSAITGKLIAATRFGTPRTGLVIGDRLAIEYVMTATDEGDV